MSSNPDKLPIEFPIEDMLRIYGHRLAVFFAVVLLYLTILSFTVGDLWPWVFIVAIVPALVFPERAKACVIYVCKESPAWVKAILALAAGAII